MTVVVDTSAVAAVLFSEPAGMDVLLALDAANQRLMSSGTLVELGIVLEARFGPIGAAVADRFLAQGGIEVVPLDRAQADEAIAAWRRFGKGRHPAGLNFGDCFTYALASTRAASVVCIGANFAATDLPVLPAR